MREINCIVCHCSDSDNPAFDNIETIREWHLERGFSDVGYHAFIDKSGAVFQGRPDSQIGAHVKGHNANSLGVCLSGKKEFTEAQFKALELYLIEKTSQYELEKTDILAHKELDSGKTCPNFDLHKWLSGLEWH